MTKGEIDAICDAVIQIGWQDSDHTDYVVTQLRARLEDEARARAEEAKP